MVKALAKVLNLGLMVLPLLCGAAHAGSNQCEGTVKAGKPWTSIVGKTGDYAPQGCRVKTASRLGRRNIAVCPDGSECSIAFVLSGKDDPRWDKDASIWTVTKMKGVYRKR